MADTVLMPTGLPTALRFRPLYAMTPDEFYTFCQQNPDMRAELSAEGEVVFMSPSGGNTGARNAHVVKRLGVWADEDGSGIVFDSSAGFILPNGAVRSPDAAWVRRPRLAKLPARQRERFLPLCPEFVVEIASPSDRLADLQAKMDEYMANGAALGWLIDPASRSVTVYRPGEPTQHVAGADRIDAGPLLPGFSLDLLPVWQPFS
jgi:Uma2 family endonuclease